MLVVRALNSVANAANKVAGDVAPLATVTLQASMHGRGCIDGHCAVDLEDEVGREETRILEGRRESVDCSGMCSELMWFWTLFSLHQVVRTRLFKKECEASESRVRRGHDQRTSQCSRS